MTMPDRRSHRYRLGLCCRYRPLTGEGDRLAEHEGVIDNVARQGCCLITTDGDLAIRGNVEIMVSLGQDEPRTTLVGETTWKRAHDAGWAYGVEFREIDPAAKWAIVAAAYDRWRTGLPAADEPSRGSSWSRRWRSFRTAIGLGGR